MMEAAGEAKRKRRVVFHKRKEAKTNTSAGVKVELRRWLVEELGGEPRILDCFAAAGVMWRKAYDSTSRYLGLDLKPFDDSRRLIQCDSRRYLRHAETDLSKFDLFDLDAFGSPLEHLALVCHRLTVPKGKRVGFALTDGTAFNTKMNAVNRGLLDYAGIVLHRHSGVQYDYRDHIFQMVVDKALKIAGLRVVAAREAKKASGAGMRYRAMVCEPA